MSHTKDMIEVQYGSRSSVLETYLDFRTNRRMPSKTPKSKRSQTLVSYLSSSSSESSESHDGESERRKLERIATWAHDVEAQMARRPLLMDQNRPVSDYMTFDTRERSWVFRQAVSDTACTQSSSFNSMLARFGMRRPRSHQRERIGWWWPWVIVALLILVLLAIAVYELSQLPYEDDQQRHDADVVW